MHSTSGVINCLFACGIRTQTAEHRVRFLAAVLAAEELTVRLAEILPRRLVGIARRDYAKRQGHYPGRLAKRDSRLAGRRGWARRITGLSLKRENHNPPISGKTVLIGGFASSFYPTLPALPLPTLLSRQTLRNCVRPIVD